MQLKLPCFTQAETQSLKPVCLARVFLKLKYIGNVATFLLEEPKLVETELDAEKAVYCLTYSLVPSGVYI